MIELENGFYAEINTTGIHTQHNYLKGRVDIFPPMGSKLLDIHYVTVPDETSPEFQAGYQGELKEDGTPVNQADYDTWWDNLPKVQRLTPCLCHFIKINELTTRQEFEDMVRAIFTSETLTDLAAILGSEWDKALEDKLLTAADKDFIAGKPAKDRQNLKRRRMLSRHMNTPEKLGNGRVLRMGKEAQATLVETVKTRFSEAG